MQTALRVRLGSEAPGLEQALAAHGVRVDGEARVVLGAPVEGVRVHVAVARDPAAALDAVADGADFAVVWPGDAGRLLGTLRRACALAEERRHAEAYRMAVRRSPEWMEITDGDLRLIDVSDGFEAATGFTREQVVGGTPAALLRSPYHPPAFFEAQWAALTGPDQAWSGDMLSRRADGGVNLCDVRLRTFGPQTRPHLAMAYRRIPRASTVDGVHSWVQDRYSLPWLLVLREDGRVLDAHADVGALLGVPGSVVATRARALGISEALPGPGEREQVERWVGARALQLAMEGRAVGDTDLVVIVVRDITDRMLDEERRDALASDLVLARDQALQAAQAKSAFLAHMSHELRTPLNAILGYAELVEDEMEEGQCLEDIRRIGRSGRQLLRLVDDVLDLARIEAGAVSIHPETFEVGPFLDDVARSLRLRAAGRGQWIEVEHDGSVWTTDPTRVRQILCNLLGNAVKYAVPGPIRVVQAGSVVQVVDTGPGMPEEELERIFEPFHQAVDDGTGVGLGLPICRRLAEALGACLDVTSEVGVGSTFTLELPGANVGRIPLVPSIPEPRRR